jgi:hypothetical protein
MTIEQAMLFVTGIDTVGTTIRTFCGIDQHAPAVLATDFLGKLPRGSISVRSMRGRVQEYTWRDSHSTSYGCL